MTLMAISKRNRFLAKVTRNNSMETRWAIKCFESVCIIYISDLFATGVNSVVETRHFCRVKFNNKF